MKRDTHFQEASTLKLQHTFPVNTADVNQFFLIRNKEYPRSIDKGNDHFDHKPQD
jgi:hypothetical protein